MGYHVTILRTSGGQRNPIGREELDAALASRPDLHAQPGPDGTLELTLAARGEESPLLVFQDGELWTSNPDEDVLQLMLELAERLGARVRGDELETYRTVSESYLHPDDAGEVEAAARMAARSQRRQRLWLALPVLAALVLGLGALLARLSRR